MRVGWQLVRGVLMNQIASYTRFAKACFARLSVTVII
jgi:hypothetical protein